MKTTWQLGLCASLLFGCTMQPDAGGAGGADDGKGDQSTGHSLRPTNQAGLALFQGFNTLFDENSAPCVDPVDQTSSAPLTVGDLQEKYQLVYVQNKNDLSRSINIDFGLSATVLQVVNANAAFDLVKSFQGSSTSVTFLLAATQNYTVTNNRPVKLQDGLPDPSVDRDAFLHRCQNYYVNGVEYEADLFVLITFNARDTQTSNMIKASLGVTAGLPGGAIIGNLDTHLSGSLVNAASMTGVSTHVMAVSRGFLLSGTDASATVPLGDSLSPDTFTKIDGLRTTMAQSVLNDQCRDAGGQGQTCNGVPSPGYENNRQRSATPVGVLLGSYQRAVNAPFYHGANPFQQMDTELKQAETFIRGYTAAELQLENIYDTEIAPYEAASAAQKAAYNLAPPQSPASTTSSLDAAVAPWHVAFLPETGSAVAPLRDQILACWDHGSDTDFTDCHLGTDPKTLPEYQAAQAQIANYSAHGRVLPLSFATGAQAVKSAQAAATCGALSIDGAALRRPTYDEAQALGIFVATAALPAPSAANLSHAVWIDDASCGPSVAFQADGPFWSEVCSVGTTTSLPAVCVPSAGPFGTVPDLSLR